MAPTSSPQGVRRGSCHPQPNPRCPAASPCAGRAVARGRQSTGVFFGVRMADLDIIVKQAIRPAYDLLPSRMASDAATVMLLAIGL